MLHLLRQDWKDNHLGGRYHPYAPLHGQDNTARRWWPVQHCTVQIQPDKLGVRPHPLWDGAHDPALDFLDRPSHRGPRPHSLGSMPSTSWPAKVTDDLGAATCSRTIATTPPGEQETMTKATARPQRAGQLVNHHHANSVVTTGTIASATPRRDVGARPRWWPILERVMTPGQDGLACKPSILTSPTLGLTTTRSGEPFSICNLAPKLYIRAARPPIQGDELLRLHLGFHTPHSYHFPLAYTPHYENFRALNRGTRTWTISETGRRASA
jgi:hypothetical protein